MIESWSGLHRAVVLLGATVRQVKHIATALGVSWMGPKGVAGLERVGHTLSWGLVCCRMHMHSGLPQVVGCTSQYHPCRIVWSEFRLSKNSETFPNTK
jgi:hypothetical protein